MAWTRAQQHQADEQIKDLSTSVTFKRSLQHTQSACVQKSASTARYIIESVQMCARMK
eukprot:jgi/Antlo1/571/2264